MRATVAGCLGLAISGAAVTAAEPENIVMCRMSAPEICFVSPHPQAHARYRERCRQAPETCKFRADGTVERWTGYYVAVSNPVPEELRNRADDALARLRAPQDVFGEVNR